MQSVDAIIVGQALNDQGFIAYDAIAGLGLNTFGFLWPCSDVWAPQQRAITTTWVGIQTSTVTTETCSD